MKSDFAIKGQRDYLSGSIVFDFIVDKLRRDPRQLEIVFYEKTLNNCLFVTDAPPADATLVGKYRDPEGTVYILETPETIIRRVDYPEDKIVAACRFDGVTAEVSADIPDFSFIEKLVAAASACCDGESFRLLRTYWYDGAADDHGVPSATQVAVGELAKVKLRLGRMTASGQKGVDGLIILDLITLARNRAVDVAILFTGDEDLREAALHAQGFGLTLVVAGFPPTAGQGQSKLLLREADHVQIAACCTSRRSTSVCVRRDYVMIARSVARSHGGSYAAGKTADHS